MFRRSPATGRGILRRPWRRCRTPGHGPRRRYLGDLLERYTYENNGIAYIVDEISGSRPPAGTTGRQARARRRPGPCAQPAGYRFTWMTPRAPRPHVLRRLARLDGRVASGPDAGRRGRTALVAALTREVFGSTATATMSTTRRAWYAALLNPATWP